MGLKIEFTRRNQAKKVLKKKHVLQNYTKNWLWAQIIFNLKIFWPFENI
jgi:hypothetical protein